MGKREAEQRGLAASPVPAPPAWPEQVDLAGSERSEKTGAEAGGKRFSEGCSINFALTALGQVERRWGRQFAYVQICTQMCTQICIGAVVAQAFFRDAL